MELQQLKVMSNVFQYLLKLQKKKKRKKKIHNQDPSTVFVLDGQYKRFPFLLIVFVEICFGGCPS